MKSGDIEFLGQLVRTLEESLLKMEEAYNKKNYEEFNKSKKLFMQMQEKIGGIANE